MSAKGTADDETLDLVFKALSNGTRRRILDLLKELTRETGSSLILITHDLGVVARYADRVADAI